jgi:hypothetical protein
MEHKLISISVSLIAPVAVAAILILGILAGISSTAAAGKTVKTPYVSKTVKTPYVSKTVKTPYVSKTVRMTFTAKLTGNNEVPPVNTPATGTAHFELSSDGKVLNYDLSSTNLKGFTNAYIIKRGENESQYCCSPEAVAELSMGKGKITWQDLMGPLEDSPVSYLINIMRSGETYVIVDTQQHQNGEIRGQISSS